ncbi:MAG: cyclic nucleotide-binding domain-containing protein [Bacteroidota bacterium]
MMISKSLSSRTADFLFQFPPFSFIQREELEGLASQVKIVYYTEGEYIFQEGEEATGMLYVLNKGQVNFYKSTEEEEKLIDVCDVGDTFGIRSFLSENPFLVSAKVVQEAVVCIFEKEKFASILENFPKVSLYFAAGFAAGQPVVRPEKGNFTDVRKELSQSREYPFLFREPDVIKLPGTLEVITCSPSQKIQEAAQLMSSKKIGSLVVVNSDKHPVGILTKSDFTRKVATGLFSIHEEVRHFLDFLGTAVMVAHHANFDVAMIRKMIREKVKGFYFYNPVVDTATMARKLLYPDIRPEYINPKSLTLDALVSHYRISTSDRHTAWGDALITAKLFLIMLKELGRKGPVTLQDLQ